MDLIEFLSAFRILKPEFHGMVKRRRQWLIDYNICKEQVLLPHDILHTFSPHFALEAFLLDSLYSKELSQLNSCTDYVFSAACVFSGIQLKSRSNTKQQLDCTEYVYILTTDPFKSIVRIINALNDSHVFVNIISQTLDTDDSSRLSLINEIFSVMQSRLERGLLQYIGACSQVNFKGDADFIYINSNSNLDNAKSISQLQIGSLIGYRLGSSELYINAIDEFETKLSSQASIIFLDRGEVIKEIVLYAYANLKFTSMQIKHLDYSLIDSTDGDYLLVVKMSVYPHNFREDFDLGDF